MVVVNKDVVSIKRLFLLFLADFVPDSARPGSAVPSLGSVPPSATGTAVLLLRRLALGAVKALKWLPRVVRTIFARPEQRLGIGVILAHAGPAELRHYAQFF